VALAGIGGVGAVADGLDTEFAGGVVHRAEPHRPAVITAVAAVLDEIRVVQLGELDDLVADADFVGHPSGVVEFRRWQRLASGRTGDRPLAERVGGEGSDDRRVDATGKRHDRAVFGGQILPKGRGFR